MKVSIALGAWLAVLSTSTVCSAQVWPYNLPQDAKYYPEDEGHIKRELRVQELLAEQSPVYVRKMSDDEGEKFFLQYWSFGENWSNSSIEIMEPAIARHTNRNILEFHLLERDLFARDFKCPDNTNACSDINSSLCCPNGETCVRINNGVGCCPSASSCGGSIGQCDTGAGYKSCTKDGEGGCCIPGAECQDSGCVFYGTSTTTTIASSATSSTSSSSFTSGNTQTVTVTTTVRGQATTILSTATVVISSKSTCSSSFQSCPSSLGGGCCPTDRVCGTSNSCVASTVSSSASASAPIRPTSVTESTVTGATAPTTSGQSSNEACPTGFYMCEARYLGGCCRVGRDCQTTSCPSMASTQVANSGATVLVPASASQGSCPNNWIACGSTASGGCCPSNYLCGVESCTATISGQQNTGKMAPSAGVSSTVIWGFFIFAFTTAIGMIMA